MFHYSLHATLSSNTDEHTRMKNAPSSNQSFLFQPNLQIFQRYEYRILKTTFVIMNHTPFCIIHFLLVSHKSPYLGCLFPLICLFPSWQWQIKLAKSIKNQRFHLASSGRSMVCRKWVVLKCGVIQSYIHRHTHTHITTPSHLSMLCCPLLADLCVRRGSGSCLSATQTPWADSCWLPRRCDCPLCPGTSRPAPHHCNPQTAKSGHEKM